MVVVAAWSLLIYYWAMEVALSTEMIEEMIGEVELPEADMQMPTRGPERGLSRSGAGRAQAEDPRED